MQQGQPCTEGEPPKAPPSLRLSSLATRPSSSSPSSLFAPLGSQSSLAPPLDRDLSPPCGVHQIPPPQNVNNILSSGRSLSPMNSIHTLNLSYPNSSRSAISPTFRGTNTNSPRVGSDPNAAHDIADLAISAVDLAEQQSIQRSRDLFLRQSRERGRGSSSGLSSKGSGSGISASAEQVIDSVVEAFLSCGGGSGCGDGRCTGLTSSSYLPSTTLSSSENVSIRSTLSRTNSPLTPIIPQEYAPRSSTPVSDSDEDEELNVNLNSRETSVTNIQVPLSESFISGCDEMTYSFKKYGDGRDSEYLLAQLANRRVRLNSLSSLRTPEKSPSDVVKKGDKAWKDGGKCQECELPFSMSNRRHHCRACGSILCKPCVPYRKVELFFESRGSSDDSIKGEGGGGGGSHTKNVNFSRMCLRCHALACGRVLPVRKNNSNFEEKVSKRLPSNSNADDALCWLDCIALCDAREVEARIRLGQDVNAIGCVSIDGVSALHVAAGIPAFASSAEIAHSNASNSPFSQSVGTGGSEINANVNTNVKVSSPTDKPKCASVGFCLSSLPGLIGNFLGKKSSNGTQDLPPQPVSFSSSSPLPPLRSIPSHGGNMYLSSTNANEAERTLFSVLHCLIQAGADVNAVTNSRRTPLHYAAAYGTPQVVEFLLAKGAMQHAVDKNGLTAFDYAQLRAARGDIIGRCILLDGLLMSSSSTSSLLIEHATRLSQCEADTAARKRLVIKIRKNMASEESRLGIKAIVRQDEERDNVAHSSASISSARVTLDSVVSIKSRTRGNLLSKNILDVPPDVSIVSQDMVIKRAAEHAKVEPLPSLRSAQVSSLNICCLAQAAQDLQRNLISVRNSHERYICERIWPLLLCDKAEEYSLSRIRNSSFLVRALQTGLVRHKNALSLMSPKLGDLSVHSSSLIGQVWLLGHTSERDCEGKGLSIGITLAELAEKRLKEIQGEKYVRPIGLRSDKDEEKLEAGVVQYLKPSIQTPDLVSNSDTTSIPPPMISHVSLSNNVASSTIHSVTAPLSCTASPSLPCRGLRISIQRSATAPTDSKSSSSIAMARRPVQSLPNIRTPSLVHDSDGSCGSSVEFPVMNRLTASSGICPMSSLVGFSLSMPRLRIPQDPEVAAHFRAKELEKELEKDRMKDIKKNECDKEKVSEVREMLTEGSILNVSNLLSSDERSCDSVETNTCGKEILCIVDNLACPQNSITSMKEVIKASQTLLQPLSSPLSLKIRTPVKQVHTVDLSSQSNVVDATELSSNNCGITESTSSIESSALSDSTFLSLSLPLRISEAIVRHESMSFSGADESKSAVSKNVEESDEHVHTQNGMPSVSNISSILPTTSTTSQLLPSSKTEQILASSSLTNLVISQKLSNDAILDGQEAVNNEKNIEESSLSSIGVHVAHRIGHLYNDGHHAHGHRGHKHHHGHRSHIRHSCADAILTNQNHDSFSSTISTNLVKESGCVHRHSFHGWLHGGRSKPSLRHGLEGDGAAMAPKSCLKSHSTTGKLNDIEIDTSSILHIEHQLRHYQAVQMLDKGSSTKSSVDTLHHVLDIDPQRLDLPKRPSPILNSRSDSPALTTITSLPSSFSSRSSSIGVDDGHLSVETHTAFSSSNASVTGLSIESSSSDPATMSFSLLSSSSSSSSTTTSTSCGLPSLAISLPALKSQPSYGNDGMLPFIVPPSPSLSQVSGADSRRSGSGGSFFFNNLDQAAPSSPSFSIENASTPPLGLSPNDSPVLRSETGNFLQFPGGNLNAEVRSRTMSEFSISSVSSTGARPSRSVSFLDFEPARDVIVYKPTSLVSPLTDDNTYHENAESGGESSAGESSATPGSSGVSDDDAFAEEMNEEGDDAYYSSTRSDQSIDGSAADDDDGELADRSDVGHIENKYSQYIESSLGGRLGRVMHHNTRQRHGKGEGKVKKEELNTRVSSLVRGFSSTSTTTSNKALSNRRRSGSPIASAGSKTARAGGAGLTGPGSIAPHRRIAAARNASDVDKQRGGHGYHHNLISTTRVFSILDSDSDDDSEGGYGSDDDSDGGCGAPIATAGRASIPVNSLTSLNEVPLIDTKVQPEMECAELPAAVVAALKRFRDNKGT